MKNARLSRTPVVLDIAELSLSVVLPTYNTGEAVVTTITDIQRELRPYLDAVGPGIVVCDDGSTLESRTADLARSCPEVTVLARGYNLGKGASVREGMAHTTADVVAFTDGDGAYDPALLITLLRAVTRADLVIGVRPPGAAGGRSSLVRNLGSRFFHLLTSLALDTARTDTQAGIKLMRREVADAFAACGAIDRFSFDVELLALCECRGWVITEVPVKPRSTDGSTVKFSSELVRTLREILAVRRNRRHGLYSQIHAEA